MSIIDVNNSIHTDLFTEKLNLSEKLISRFVSRQQPVNSSDNSASLIENQKTRKQRKKENDIARAKEKSDQRDLEATERDANENLNLFPETLNSVPFTAGTKSEYAQIVRLHDTKHLPEFSSLHEKVNNNEERRVMNLAHANLGDERCVILSKALNDTTQDPYTCSNGHRVVISLNDSDHHISMLSLCDNRISDMGMETIMKHMMSASRLQKLVHLDVSDNKVGKNGAIALAQCVCKLPNLQRLNISNMNLSDVVLEDIFSFLGGAERGDSLVHDRPYLRTLIASKNHLGVKGARALSSYLWSPYGSGLVELNISWNNLGIEGGSKLWKALCSHEHLVSLDISWNSLGNRQHEELLEKDHPPVNIKPPLTFATLDGEGSVVSGEGSNCTAEGSFVQKQATQSTAPPSEVISAHFYSRKVDNVEYVSALALKNLFRVNNVLLHANISHNAFCAKECDMIGEGLSENHTLLGLHITGNSGRVDSHGYLTSDYTAWPLDAAHAAEPIIHDVSNKEYHNYIRSQSFHSKMNYYDRNSFSNRNSCWVCGRWTEVEFEYKLTDNDIKKLREVIEFNRNNYTVHRRDKISDLFPVHLFTSFDGWQPEKMSMPSPVVVKSRNEHAPVHSTSQQRKEDFMAVLSAKNSRKNRQPKIPQQPAPSRRIHRRRSSLPNSSMEALLNDTTVAGTNEEDCGITRSGDTTVAEPRMCSPLSKNRVVIERNKSIATHSITNHLLEAVERREDNEEKENDEKANVLLYDYLDKSSVDAVVVRQLEQNTKLLDILQSIGVEGYERDTHLRRRNFENFDPSGEFCVVNLDDKAGLVYRLRRMVPPGSHCFVFFVGYDFGGGEDPGGANTVIDTTQPCQITASALKPESIQYARSQGVSLPKFVNTIQVAANDLSLGSRNVLNSVPAAVILASQLCHPANAKLRMRSLPSLRNRKKLWNRMESVLYKQWVNHQNKYLMECFHCDWKQSSIYALLMGVTSDEDERFEIMNTLKENYDLLKSVYDYYWASFSADATGLNGLGYNELVRKCDLIGPAVNQLTMDHLDQNDTSQLVSGGGRRRRSSFPPTSLIRKVSNVEATEDVSFTGSSGDDGVIISAGDSGKLDMMTSVNTPPSTINVKVPRTVVALNPRGSKAITAPRSSAMIKQLTLHRNIREKLKESPSSSDDDFFDDEDNSRDDDSRSSKLGRKASVLERRLSTVEQLIKPSSMTIERKQSIVGGKVIETNELPWKCGNPDGSCSLQDIDMIFVSNCVTGQKNDLNNKRSLLRFQFLDCIVAVACIKYLNSKICDNIPSALEFFIGNHIRKLALKRNDGRFIKVILPSRPIDNILKFYLKGLQQSFNCLSIPSEANHNIRTLTLSKWMKLCELSELNLEGRLYKHCFMFSKMQGIVDVFGPAYHPKELQFIEYVEGIARLAYSKQVSTTAVELEKITVGLSQADLDQHVTVTTVGHILKEICKLFIKNASMIYD